MDIETVRKIWEMETALNGRDSMARAAVKSSNFEFMELLHSNLGPDAFIGNAKKDPSDAIITAARLGRLQEMRWMLDKGIGTRFEYSSNHGNGYSCPAIKGACDQGRSECLHELLEHFDLYNKGGGCVDFGYTMIDPVQLHMNALSKAAVNGEDISRGVEIFLDVMKRLDYEPTWRDVSEALLSGLHEIVVPMLKRGARINISKLSGDSSVYRSSGLTQNSDRHAACWRAIAEHCEQYDLGFSDVFVNKEIVRANQYQHRSGGDIADADRCQLMLSVAGRVEYEEAGSSDAVSVALIDLLHSLDPKLLPHGAVKDAINANKPVVLDHLLGLGVEFRPEHMSALTDADCAKVLHQRGFDLNETWYLGGYSSRGSRTQTECSVLSSALSRGSSRELALLQVLYEAGVDFGARVNDRTMAQYAAKADDSIKRFMKACKTGMTIQSAFTGDAADASTAPKVEDFGNIL